MPNILKPGSPFLVDSVTGGITGIKNADGSEALFAAVGGEQIARAAARYPAKHRPGSSFLNVAGDSWANGNGASVGSRAFANRLATRYGSAFRVSNYGYSGRPISGYQQAPRVSGTNQSNAALIQTALGDVTFGIFGLNDLNGIDVNAGNTGCGPRPENFPNLMTRVQAVASWFMVPESSRVRMHTLNNSGQNPAVTFSGTWNHGGFQNNPNFSFGSGANGEFVQLTTTPGDLLIIRHATVNGTGTMRVTVDGVDVLDRSIQSQYESFFTIDSTILKLPAGGAHTVRLTAVGATLLMVDSVDCVDTSTDFSATLLYSPPTYLTTAGWAATANSPNSSTVATATGASVWLYDNGGCDRFGAAIREAMDGLFLMGFNVAELPIRQGWNPNFMTSGGDPLHPNDQGHAHIFDRAAFGVDRLLLGR